MEKNINIDESLKKVKAFMEQTGLGRSAFAELTGCSRSAVQGWYRGKTIPDLKHRKMIAKAFNIDPNSIVVFDGIKKEDICSNCMYAQNWYGNSICDYSGIIGKRRPCKGPMYSEDGRCTCFREKNSGTKDDDQTNERENSLYDRYVDIDRSELDGLEGLI